MTTIAGMPRFEASATALIANFAGKTTIARSGTFGRSKTLE